MAKNLYITFDRGRDDVVGPTFGPFDLVQQTYEYLRVHGDDVHEHLAAYNHVAGEWFILDGEHAGEFYSDFHVFASEDKHVTRPDHNCEHGKSTFGVGNADDDVEMRWNAEKSDWECTGRKFVGTTWTEVPRCPECGEYNEHAGEPTCEACKIKKEM